MLKSYYKVKNLRIYPENANVSQHIFVKRLDYQ